MNIAVIPARGGSGFGLAPKYYDEILGKIASQDISAGRAFDWNLIDMGSSQMADDSNDLCFKLFGSDPVLDPMTWKL